MKFSMYAVGITYLLATLVGHAVSQTGISPCPRLFRYDPDESKPGQWAGVLTLLSDYELTGLWVRVVLDKPALGYGSSIGQVEKRDGNEFLIRNSKLNLTADSPIEVSFYVKYEPEEQPPKLVSFRLNARTVCPPLGENDAATSDGSCGKVVVPNPLTMDEQVTHEGEFPWHVALYNSRDYDLSFVCGGSLVTRNTFITAAHCVSSRSAQKIADLESLTAVLGKYSLKRWTSRNIQNKQIQSITIHPDYDPSTLQNDIAIVKLEEPVDITTNVHTVCLWDGDVGEQNNIDKEGTVVGWGYDSSGEASEVLTKAKMIFTTRETCQKTFPDYFLGSSSNKAFCAAYKKGTTVCNCEAGNGMVFPRKSKSGSTVWQLRGVVSATTHHFKCDSSRHTAFIDVAKYTDWINTNLK